MGRNYAEDVANYTRPFDIVITLLDSLSEAERDKVRKALNMQQLTPCQKSGHSFCLKREVPPLWLFRFTTMPQLELVCRKCGLIIVGQRQGNLPYHYR